MQEDFSKLSVNNNKPPSTEVSAIIWPKYKSTTAEYVIQMRGVLTIWTFSPDSSVLYLICSRICISGRRVEFRISR